MKISIINKYKSIDLCEFELPNFTVLTGKNGSGKTHLLEAMSDNNTSKIEVEGKLVKNIKYIGFNGLNPNIVEQCDPTTITQFIKQFWSEFYNQKKKYLNSKQKFTSEIAFRYFSIGNKKHYLEKILKNTSKSCEELTEDDFHDSFDVSFMGQNDFLIAQFAAIFKQYHLKFDENEYNRYRRSKGHSISKSVLSDEEFIEKYGTPPWKFINSILFRTGVPYKVNSPLDLGRDATFNFKLIDIKNEFEISAIDLSTGEKVLMSLALAIYSLGDDYGKPDILLIDEPGAPLHPSMSKVMIDVLKDEIVDKNNIPVVITTHSPTTVICTEGSSIFQKERETNEPLPISVQEAVEILSSDIPFLKISNEKRRQVMVESKNDVVFYELLSNILSRKENLPSAPIFFQAGSPKGSNCQDVKRIVKDLSSAGNDQIYGIIDWDRKNKPEGRVLVLGENQRYAIENYLLDPLEIGLLLIRETYVKIDYFGGLSFSAYSEVHNLTEDDAQKIIDKVLNDLALASENTVKYNLYNGWELNISEEFNNYQGHELEIKYKERYPYLKSYKNEDALKRAVIEKVVYDHPGFAPKELFDTIKMIK